MTTPADRATRIAERHGVSPRQFAEEIAPDYRPVVLRGLCDGWPSVAAGRRSTRALADYLLGFDRGSVVKMLAGGSAIKGRFFYRPDMTGFNFDRAQILLSVLVEALVKEEAAAEPRALYAGSAPAEESYPGWLEDNRLPVPTPGATPRVWIGNASRVTAHFDVSANIAVVAAGRRRFTLFPPDQTANLYVGPLDWTIAGQPTSMVDIEAPDLDRFPRFAAAQAAMQVADLEPGDALFIPSLWWHEVRATGPLNVLVNYWWGQRGGSPFAAVIHALETIRDLPPAEREAVRAWFDTWIFGDRPEAAADHLPPQARGVLGPPSPERTRRIREYLLQELGR